MSKFQSGGVPIILLVLILMAIVGFGGYYIGTQNPSPQPQNQPSPTTVGSISTASKPTSSVTSIISALPSGWTYQEGNFCKVSVPIPPKAEPYYIPDNPNTPPAVDDEGGWWNFDNIVREPNPTEKFFTNESVAAFRNPEVSGHDYVAGFVQVICGPNKNNYTTETFIEAYKKQFTDGTFGGLNFEEVGAKTLWGKQVMEANITGGMYSGDDHEYYFATPSKLYRIRKLSYSQLQIIKDTTNQIFENLKFSN